MTARFAAESHRSLQTHSPLIFSNELLLVIVTVRVSNREKQDHFNQILSSFLPSESFQDPSFLTV